MLWPKKNSYKEFDNEKKFLQLENSPPPPITFLMVRPLFYFLSLFKDIELRYSVVTLRHAACLIGYQFFRSHFHRGILEIKIWRNVMDVVVYEENTSFLADFRHLL